METLILLAAKHTVTIYLFNHTLFKAGLILIGALVVVKIAAFLWELLPIN